MFFKYVCLIVLLASMSCCTQATNILCMFTSQHRSHMLVYVGVIKSLLTRGHKMTIITVLPIQDMLPKNIRIIQLKRPPEPERVHGIFRQIAVIAANSRTLDDERFKQFLLENNRFDLVILGYLFNDYELGVAAHFKCPSLVIWTAQPHSFVNRFLGNPNGWSFVPQPFVRSQAVGISGVLYGTFETVFKWIFDFIMEKAYRELFFHPKYPTLAEMRNNVSLVLCNHHFSEGPIAANLPGIIEISGIQIEQNITLSKTLKEFLDSAEKGFIYFSLGSVVSTKRINKSTLRMFSKVLSTLPQKVIWKIENLPGNFSNMLTGEWFPQTSILAHPNIRLFISHGGKGSITEAINYAVPMIAIPFFGDQFGGAKRLEKNGFGLEININNVTEVTFRHCIFKMLNNSNYSKNIKIASSIYKDRPISAEETAVYWIEYVIRHNGAHHLQSPIKLMNFVEYSNIDVYLFCICVIYAVISAIKIAHEYVPKIHQKIFHVCRQKKNKQ